MIELCIFTIPYANETNPFTGKSYSRMTSHATHAVEHWLRGLGGIAEVGHYGPWPIENGVFVLQVPRDVVPNWSSVETFLKRYRGGIPDYVRSHLRSPTMSIVGSVEAGHYQIKFIDAFSNAEWEEKHRETHRTAPSYLR